MHFLLDDSREIDFISIKNLSEFLVQQRIYADVFSGIYPFSIYKIEP